MLDSKSAPAAMVGSSPEVRQWGAHPTRMLFQWRRQSHTSSASERSDHRVPAGSKL